ncbi:MAG: ABC transporter ATP-binding protein, partial [Armatimonadetes bacterium]|nr:ABC transporter ATP-binding protein [Armatimonadota bacterium]
MLELRGVSKIYRAGEGEIRALDGVSVRVEAGEFVAVRGPSGCGKSTLLMAAAGMARPSAGRVLLDGEDLYALSPRRRAAVRAAKVGFVFQMFHLIPYLSVWENILSPLVAGARGTRDDARAIAERVGLTERLGHRPSELSTGERQRVALARALLNRPQLILADEPIGNLDPENGRAVMDFLAEFNAEGGTVLLVTHEELAAGYAQRTI